MTTLKLFALFSSIAIVSAIPIITTAADRCCFTLHDASSGQKLQQNQNDGYLYLGSSQPDGEYCIESGTEILRDTSDDSCFIDPDQQVKCLDPIPSSDKWTFSGDGSKRMAYNGKTTYRACPASNGGELIWSSDKDGEGCREVELEPRNLQGTC